MLEDRKLVLLSSKLTKNGPLKNWVDLFDKSLIDTDYCSAALHSQYRCVLGQVNLLQSRTQYQACYRFSRCASAAAGPTIVDARELDKLVRSIRGEPCALRYWPLKGSLRLVGYLDAAQRYNADISSQRGQAVFHGRRTDNVQRRFGSMVDLESHKINRVGLSTTVSDCYSCMKLCWNLSVSLRCMDGQQCRACGHTYAT